VFFFLLAVLSSSPFFSLSASFLGKYGARSGPTEPLSQAMVSPDTYIHRLLPSRKRKAGQAVTLSCQGSRSRNLLALITGLAIFNYRCCRLSPGKFCLSAEFYPNRRHTKATSLLATCTVPSVLGWKPVRCMFLMLGRSQLHVSKRMLYKMFIFCNVRRLGSTGNFFG
jgi:hypothetical protein